MQGDFIEGVRALLVDKDKNPIWKYTDIDTVPDDAIARFYKLEINIWIGHNNALQLLVVQVVWVVVVLRTFYVRVRVILLDHSEQALSAAQDTLTRQGFQAEFIETLCVDITDESAVEKAFSSIKKNTYSLTALIQCAGILQDGLLLKARDGTIEKKLSLAQWQKVIDVNLTGSFLCGREAASVMVEQRQGGVIINIASVAKAGNIGQSNYSATKAGVSALVVCWARELAQHHIRVAGIAPGVFETEMTRTLKEKAMDRLLDQIPISQLGQAQDFAHAVAFILENNYFTGRVLELDGGLRM